LLQRRYRRFGAASHLALLQPYLVDDDADSDRELRIGDVGHSGDKGFEAVVQHNEPDDDNEHDEDDDEGESDDD
jgi:hypothetical protein